MSRQSDEGSEFSRRAPRCGRLRSNVFDRSLRIEFLESRRLLAGVVVGNNLDVVNGNTTTIANLIAAPGADGISLREAVLAANATAGADVITFASALSGGTINFALGELLINDALAINGPGAKLLTLRAFDPTPLAKNFDGSRIFTVDDGAGTVKTVSISGLTLTGGDVAGHGGAIFNRENLTVASSTISGSKAGGGFGGGLYNGGASGVLTLTGTTVSDNFASYGGGVMNIAGMVSVTNSTISGNYALVNGGGIQNNNGTLNVSQSTISGNTGSTAGGGILTYYDVSTTLTNVTISGNVATQGGGLWARSSHVTAAFSTVTGNSAFGSGIGGGLRLITPVSTMLDHALVAGNIGASSPRDDIAGAVTARFSLIGDFSGSVITDNGGNLFGTSSSPINPLIGPLAYNGGPTRTHALLVGSRAIDAGDPNVGFDSERFDQRGASFVRVFDGDLTGGARVDIGAYERQLISDANLVVDTTVDDSDGDYSPGHLSLREAITLADAGIGANTITFAPAMSGATIMLGGTELLINDAITIDGRPLVNNVTINANQSSRILNITAATGNFTLAGLTLTGGRTTGNVAGVGGAISFFSQGDLTIDKCTISGNSTTQNGASGGGIYAIGNLSLTKSTISGNSTAGLGALGGGIFVQGNLTLANSTVSGNSTSGSTAGGGGIEATGALTLIQSTVSGNSTAGSASHGGGILAFGQVTLTQSTVTGNRVTHSSAEGGGVFQVDTFSSSPFSISGSIVAGNTASGGGADLVKDPGATLTLIYSLIGFLPPQGPGGILSFGTLTGVPPLLGPLDFNGGVVQTHAPLLGGPAVNAGDPSIVFSPTEFDQRGFPYVRVSGGRIDIGAVELQPPPASGEFDGDGDIDGADFLAWQRGLGSTGAAANRANGNADNDDDVDAADLAVWKAQFGASAQIASASTESSAVVVGDQSSALSPHAVDAALAWQQMLADAAPRRSFRTPLRRR